MAIVTSLMAFLNGKESYNNVKTYESRLTQLVNWILMALQSMKMAKI